MTNIPRAFAIGGVINLAVFLTARMGLTGSPYDSIGRDVCHVAVAASRITIIVWAAFALVIAMLYGRRAGRLSGASSSLMQP